MQFLRQILMNSTARLPDVHRPAFKAPMALEPRFMFDAAGAATGADAAQDAAAEAEAVAENSPNAGAGANADAVADAISGHVPAENRKEVVIVDPSVASYQDLLAGMDPNIEVIILSEGATVEDIATALEGRNGIDAVHLISHGGVGSLNLGGEILSLDTLDANADALRTIGNALSADGDILLYGCNVGADGAGGDFLSAFAVATGADVAASSDETGAAALGGDWVLEESVGSIETGVAISGAAQENYAHTLAVFDWTSNTADGGASVTQTVSGVTITIAGGNMDVTNGGGLAGSSGSVAFENSGYQGSFTISFSSAVNLTTMRVGRVSGHNSLDILYTVTDGSGNGQVTQSAANYASGSDVTLNWTSVTSFTVAANGSLSGTSFSALFDNINFTAANAAPALGGTPADVTVTEDVATAIDLSAYNVSDGDGDTITLTLAVDAGTIASIDGNGTTSGVTVANSGTGSMTLQGTAANLNTYLNDTTKIRYTTALNSTASATLTVTPNDGTVNGTADTVTLNVTPVNDNPTGSLPASVTVTEDTLSNVDLSAASFADVDSASITVTLTASAGTFATPADGAGVGGGVTETLVNATTITLVGSAADINTYLDTASNIRYTPASNVNGAAAATITVTANDGNGSGNVALGTVNVNITAVNDNPTGSLPASVTVTEDTLSNVDLSAASFADVDSASITVTLTASAGTFATPADGAGVGGGVTETLVNATTITLVGSAADINTYLDTASNIRYTPASNANGVAAATITVTANDGDGSGNVALGTVNVNITAVNDNPTGSLPASVTVTEDTLSNVDLSAASFADVDGDTITVTLTASAGTFATPADGAGVGGGVTETLVNATTITLVGSAADINTYLDTASNIRYTPASNVNGAAAATITVTANDGNGSGNVALGTVNVNITAVNDNPTGSLPASVTVTEDTLSNVDLSAASFADVDSASITVTLTASAGTFATPADGAGVGGGVTETLVNATTITLVGSAADINTYLDTVSNIRYTPASNVNGVAAATITVTANDGDGSGNVALGTVNVNITAVNDNPTGSVPASVTVTEDTLSNVDLSAASFADVDGDTVTVTLTASAGTFATPADGAGVGGGVTETLVNATTITLVGAAADINTYLDTASNIRYTPASNVSGNSAATITVTVNDGQGSGNVAAGTVQVNVTAVNDAPALAGLDGTPSFTEGGAAVVLDSNVTVTDVELGALNGGNGNFAGASLVIVRNGGANATDTYSIVTGGNLTVAGSNVSSGGNVIASFDTSSAGQVTITFQNNGTIPTTALVNEVMQAIRYTNTSNDPPATAQLNWTFSDGNSANAQGTGDNPGTATGSTTVSITNVNDAPTLTATGQNPTYVEGAGGADLFSGVTAGTVEAADRISSMTLTVTNLSDGASEILGFDGSDVALTNGTNVTTATNGLSVSVSVTGSTATVSFSGATLSVAQFQTLVDGMTYRNTSDNPTTAGNRVITITGITDNGGTANGGSNAAAPNLTSTVSLTAVNDAPVIGNLNGDSTSLQVGNASTIDNGGNVTVTNADSADYNGGSLIISDNGGNNTANGNFSVDGTNVTSGGDGTISAGETISVGGVNIGTVNATNDGQAGRSLEISFNSNATNARVQTLLQNIRWGAAAGTGAQTFTATLNDADGTANGGAQSTTANFTMTIGNLPVISNLSGDSVTFTENGGAVVLDSGGNATVTDADNPANYGGGNLIVTVSANAVAAEDILTFSTAGTVALAGTTAGSNVSVGGTVIGTLANNIAAGNNLVVNFNTNATLARVQTLVQAIAYNNASEAPTTTTRTVSVTLTDNDSLSSAASTVSVAVSAVNDAPVFTGLDGTPTVNEQTATVLDSNATIADAELDALNGGAGNYNGATLTLSRNGGANAQDRFANTGTLAALTQGGNLTVGATTIGTVTTNSAGTLLLTFNANATTALVNSAIQQITYTNTSDTPPANVQINYVFSDGNSGAQGSGGAGSDSNDSVTVTITPVNDAPTASGIPASVTVTEDVLSNIDLSAVSFADLDGNNLTVTLTASAGTFATPGDGAAVGAGVTETLVNATTITLAGSAADIATYLDTTTNIRYTTTANAAGNGVATITIAANDGTVNPTLGTVQINATAVNDAPTATGVPAAVTVTEDTISNIDLSAITFTEVDGDTLTVTLTASAGTFATPGDGAAVGAGVTETLVNATTITLVGSAADISTYLDTATNIRYTTAANADGNAVATITITAGDGTVTPTLGTVNINSTGVNDAPGLVGVDNSVVFDPSGGTPVVLDSNMTVSDPELTAANNYNGFSVQIQRSGGADATDLFAVRSSANVTIVGGNAQVGGNTIATLNTTTAGRLVITFTSGNGTTATTALINEVLQNVTYATNAATPTSPVTIELTPNDGTVGGTAQTLTATLRPPAPVDDFVPPPTNSNPPPAPPPLATAPPLPPPPPSTPVRDGSSNGSNPGGPAQNNGGAESAIRGTLGSQSAIENTGTPVRVSVVGTGNGLVANAGAGLGGGTNGGLGGGNAGGFGGAGGGLGGGLGGGGFGGGGLGGGAGGGLGGGLGGGIGGGLGGGTGGGLGGGLGGGTPGSGSSDGLDGGLGVPGADPQGGTGLGDQASASGAGRPIADDRLLVAATDRQDVQDGESVSEETMAVTDFFGELLLAAGEGTVLDDFATALDEYLPPAA